MEACVKLGLVRSIGLSNFTIKQTTRILDIADINPANMQVCKSKSMGVMLGFLNAANDRAPWWKVREQNEG